MINSNTGVSKSKDLTAKYIIPFIPNLNDFENNKSLFIW